ncbi:MAG TPA: phytoene/squalene synthase family protein [Pirellulales bacterium]|nr:phytoene/squalene synthase family protein [Pirellulales bacterium]
MNSLSASYALCQRLARRSASNFYFSFLLLPREKRRAMCVLYAYLRHIDDLADDDRRDVAARQAALSELRAQLEQPGRDHSLHPMVPALLDTAAIYRIPKEYLTAAIDGVEMDLADSRYETFAELERYCYCVASVVGLACIHIWGFRGSEALEPARRCGVAFQLTNILRDLKEDAQRGRTYLPQEDLRRFGCTAEQLQRGEADARFLELMQFEISRAEQFYTSAAELEPWLQRDGRRVFRAMTVTYHAVLMKIKRAPDAVFRRRIRLSPWEKARIAAGALLARPRLPLAASKWEALSS